MSDFIDKQVILDAFSGDSVINTTIRNCINELPSVKTSDDCISQQAVLDIIGSEVHDQKDYLSCVRMINDLPDITSTVDYEKCPYYEPDILYDEEQNDEYDVGHCKYKPTERTDDCVSRQTVKDEMLKYGFTAPDMTVHEFVEDVLPSVDMRVSK